MWRYPITTYKCRVIIGSSEGVFALRRDILLPFFPTEGVRLCMKEDKKDRLTLIIEKVFWLEDQPDCMFVGCGTEHPGVNKDEGTYIVIPFGGMTTNLARKIGTCRKWRTIEDGDSYFTVPRQKI